MEAYSCLNNMGSFFLSFCFVFRDLKFEFIVYTFPPFNTRNQRFPSQPALKRFVVNLET